MSDQHDTEETQDSDGSTVATLRVKPAPYPQKITLPCCDNTVLALITERTSARSCRDCLSMTELVHDRDRGAGEKPTEQTKLFADGGGSR